MIWVCSSDDVNFVVDSSTAEGKIGLKLKLSDEIQDVATKDQWKLVKWNCNCLFGQRNLIK